MRISIRKSQPELRLAAVEAIGGRLKERAEVARGELRDAEQAVEDFRKQARLVRGPDATPATQQMSEFSSQIVEARAAKIEAEAKLRAAERLVAAGRIELRTRRPAFLGHPAAADPGGGRSPPRGRPLPTAG